MTRMMGVPDYEYAVAPHPLSSLTERGVPPASGGLVARRRTDSVGKRRLACE